jgi:hypothetical protein
LIYICTVHFRSEKWIDPQARYLHKYVGAPVRVLACVPPGTARRRFYLESEYEGVGHAGANHADKLKYLASIVQMEAESDDILVFLDGDAFPIAPLHPFMQQKLAEFPLVAVQRRENVGDTQPHPCFACTTVGFWRDLGGDWSPGYAWQDTNGKRVTDTGGNLLRQLQEHNVAWHPMRRSNTHDLHGLWFGVYDNVVYHHGAGFRDRIPSVEGGRLNMSPSEFRISRLDKDHLGLSTTEYATSPEFERIHQLSDDVFDLLIKDDGFHHTLGLTSI